ncbi:hypothetical protein H0G86_004448 [Trichoderma simmonsii]|uniref:Uncharacterized protein n=1 Tax=Trichoderma simmonsii TaxID=1491479 RepID=A0A8G0LCB4_9HYPO|nr:hypothetical protein H0G86_004448 [Trichoderma simmonsii]
MKLKQSTEAANGSMGAQTQQQKKRLFPQEKKKATRRNEEKETRNSTPTKARCDVVIRVGRPDQKGYRRIQSYPQNPQNATSILPVASCIS